MRPLRTPLLVGLMFFLITLGQAYPLALAFTLSHPSHPCCCSGAAKPCDCDHSGSRKLHCHDERPTGYSQPLCGGKTATQIMSFQWDPFTVERTTEIAFMLETAVVKTTTPLCATIHTTPDPPPPKG